MHSKTLICVQRFCRIQKIPDYTGVGLDRFHCIIKTQLLCVCVFVCPDFKSNREATETEGVVKMKLEYSPEVKMRTSTS